MSIAASSASPPRVRRSAHVDWVIVLLPTVIALRTFSAAGSVMVLGLLVAVAYLRKPDALFTIKAGPLVALCFASAIVFSRPVNVGPLLTLVLVGALVTRLIMTIDARKIVVSLVDGCGLYLVANVALHLVGVQSPAMAIRIGGLVESTGFVRVIFPLTWSINIPPTIAAIYVGAVIFLLRKRGWPHRIVRLVCICAAVYVLLSAGTRAPIATALVLCLAIAIFPSVTRWIAQVVVVLLAVSPLVLPVIIRSIEFALTPLMSLAVGRENQSESVSSLSGRDRIWSRTIEYWVDWVNDAFSILFGYGVNGQYRSGASATYRDWIASITRDPEHAFLHNSVLQQLFDGGLLGWALLVAALFWGSARLARNSQRWGNAGTSAVVALTALLVSAVTEVSLAPGAAYDTFFFLIVLVGIACQTVASETNPLGDISHVATLKKTR